MIHVAVLMGGWSSERSVSLMSGNGVADALTDGLLIVRYLNGLRGPVLIQGAIGKDVGFGAPTRTTALAIENYLSGLMP